MKISEETGRIIFSGLLVTSLVLIGYNYISTSDKKDENKIQFEMIKKYLVNSSSLAKSNKPILWIHNDYKLNDRNELDLHVKN